MAKITFKGIEVLTSGNLPSVGSQTPDFVLTGQSLDDNSLATLKGKKVILNIFPSIDTGTCAASVRRFNKEAAGLTGVVVLCVSRDLPFAQKRFCGAEGIDNVVTLSDFRDGNFGKAYGAEITTGPLKGLLARAVIVTDEAGIVLHTQLVGEVADEPDYSAALAAIK